MDVNWIAERVEDIFENEIKMDSSPGLPLMKYGKTNKEIFEKHLDLVITMVNHRLHALLGIEDFKIAEFENYLRMGAVDPIRVFIKNEPHKRKKIEEKRLRLISSISLIDQIIDRMLFGLQNDVEIDRWRDLPSKGGAGLSTDEQAAELAANVVSRLGFPFETNDVKAWDWRYKMWMYQISLARRFVCWGYNCEIALMMAKSRTNLHLFPIAVRLAILRMNFLAFNVFVTSDGLIIAPGCQGIQKSGSLGTLSDNCFARACLNFIVRGKGAEANTMGDDSTERSHRLIEDGVLLGSISKETWLGIIKDQYALYGFEMTDQEYVTDYPFEFCSHMIYKDKAVPLNQMKIVFKYLNSPLRFTPEQQFQVTNDLRHAPDSKVIMEFLARYWEERANGNKEDTKEDKRPGA